MKRSLPVGTINELDKSNLNVARIKEMVKDASSAIINHELDKSTRDRALFINNAHVHRFPMLRPDYNQPIEQVNGIDMASTVLSVADIANQVLCFLLPHELYILTRVARRFETIVTEGFTRSLVAYTKEAVEQSIDQPEYDLYRKVIGLYCSPETTKKPRIHELLSLTAHYNEIRDKARAHQSTRLSRSSFFRQPIHLDYAFAYHGSRGHFVRLRDLNLYVITNLDSVYSDFTYKRLTRKYDADVFDYDNDDALSYLNYDEFNLLEMRRVTDIVPPDCNVYVVTETDIEPLYFSFSVHYCDPLKKPDSDLFSWLVGSDVTPATMENKPINGCPLFDYYFQRLRAIGEETPITRTPVKRFSYKMKFGVHAALVQSLIVK